MLLSVCSDDAFGDIHEHMETDDCDYYSATLFIGNITAVFQQSVKRMLAYSSIAQAGFMLLAVFALNTDAKEGLLLYMQLHIVLPPLAFLPFW